MDSTALLEVDLSALLRNWQLLRATHKMKNCAAVVKANAYGLGVDAVAATLADAGCQHFFVATLEEAVSLRKLLTSQFIYVFNGVMKGEENGFLDYNIIPVLNDLGQFERWEKKAADIEAASAVLHVDTGMNRLGMGVDEAEKIALEPERLERAQIRLLMSHLACADEPGHPQNDQQRECFEHIRKCFPTLQASLANSAGVFLDQHFHHDMARPGCALYGIAPHHDRPNPMEHVATLSAPIIQLRTTKKENEPVGYGSEMTVPKGTRLATVAIGYADGLHRILSGTRFGGYFGDDFAPLVGRISMDLITLDVSRIAADRCKIGDMASLICPKQDVNQIADLAQTIGYEVFTRFGRRVRREYLDAKQVQSN